jgi:hypothetical protein
MIRIFISILVCCILGCSSSDDKAAKNDQSKNSSHPETKSEPDKRLDAKVIPASEAPFEQMWAELKNIPSLILITNPEEHNALIEAAKQGKSVRDLPGPTLATFRIPIEGGALKTIAVYTDAKLLKDGTTLLTQPTVDFLIAAFYDASIDGVSFNLNTPFAAQKVFTYTIEKFYLARLIGFIQGNTPEVGATEKAATESLAKGELFQAVYYGILAYERRKDESWKEAEVAKIHAMHKLGFISEAISELNWFIDKFGGTPSAAKLKAEISK